MSRVGARASPGDDKCCDCWLNVVLSPCLVLPSFLCPPRRSKRSIAHLKWCMFKGTSGSNNELCWVCDDYLRLNKYSDAKTPYGVTKVEWRLTHPFGKVSEIAGRAQSCACCSLVVEALRGRWKGRVTLDKAPFGYWINTNTYNEYNSRATLTEVDFSIPIYLSSREINEQFPDAANVHVVSKSKINMDVAKGWFHDCQHNHGVTCWQDWKSILENPHYMRVIDVEDMCVVFPAPPGCKYVALSYVWGGVNGCQVELPSAPKVDLRPYHDAFPQTIRDAMEVTRGMGMKYLWIDGICIQNCPAASRVAQFGDMHKIYGNAQFTIIAAQAEAANKGLYGIRPDSRRPCFLGQTSRRINESMALVRDMDLPKDIKTSPWSKRGWCLQEQLLSKRLLIFWDDQAYWQCNKAMIFEDMPLTMKSQEQASPFYLRQCMQDYMENGVSLKTTPTPNSILARIEKTTIDLLKLDPITQQTRERTTKLISDGRRLVIRPAVFEEYTSIIEQYSRRELTMPADALNAVNGLLEILALGLKTEMIYGLPECFLDAALLWKAQTPLERRCQDVIPSWSWAGWRGRVAYDPTVEFKPQGRKLVASKKTHLERLRPFVTWFKSGEDNSAVLVNGTGMGINPGVDTCPQDWQQAEKIPGSNSIRMSNSHIISWSPMHLQLWTMCNLNFISRVSTSVPATSVRDLMNKAGNVIGELVLDEKYSRTKLRGSTKDHIPALIVLSEAQYFSDEKLNEEYLVYDFEDNFLLYNVLLVDLDRSSGVASRKGIGKITTHAWHAYGPNWKFIRLT